MFKKIRDIVFSACFPENITCISCKQDSTHINELGLCDTCTALLEYCTQSKRKRFFAIDELFTGVNYNIAVVRSAVCSLKFSGAVWNAPFLARTITLPPDLSVDAIVPVPLHKLREYKRGYNQSYLIAKYISQRYGFPVRTDLVTRAVYTRPQSQQRTIIERRKNTESVFVASSQCKGLRILLVDDVMTSGATINNCAKSIKIAGAAAIYAAVTSVATG